MRTTLTIDDDVLTAAKALARQQGRTAGAVLSELARRALTMSVADDESLDEVLGFRPLPKRGGIVTNDIIDRLRDETDI